MGINKETIESIFLDLTDSNRFRVTPVIGDDYVRIEIRQVITNDSDDYFKYDAISEPVAMFVDYVSEVFEVPVITDYEFEYVFYWNGERIEDGFDNKAPDEDTDLVKINIEVRKKKENIARRLLRHIKIFEDYEN
jgi:hypothetical protein